MKKFCIAFINCSHIRPEILECHAYHYGPFIQECDPLLLREIYPVIHYFFTSGSYPQKLLYVPRVEGLEISKVFDLKDYKLAEQFCSIFYNRPQACHTLEEACENIDGAFIADGSGDGSDHLEIITPLLKKGIPVFIDKPFASRLADAKAMVNMAQQTGTPIFSASILSHVNEIQHFRSRWKEIGRPIGLAIVKGLGPHLGAIIHGLALAQGLFGTGVEWVECMGTVPPEALGLSNDKIRESSHLWKPGGLPLETLMMYYPNGPQVIVLNTLTFDWFSCEVYGKGVKTYNSLRPTHLRSNDIGDPEFIGGTYNILLLFKQMLETRKPPVSYETLIELIAIVEAGRMAQEQRRRIYLKDMDIL